MTRLGSNIAAVGNDLTIGRIRVTGRDKIRSDTRVLICRFVLSTGCISPLIVNEFPESKLKSVSVGRRSR
jgi:hypothetical protein